MRRFLLLSLVFSSISFAVFYGLYAYSLPSDAARFRRLNKQFDVINLGTSHGTSFIYTDLSINGDQFTVPANSPYYDLQNYLYLKPYLNEGAVVILPISYFSFGTPENREDKGTVNPFVNHFYHYLPHLSILDYSLNKHFNVIVYSLQTKMREVVNLDSFGGKRLGRRAPSPIKSVKKLDKHALVRATTHVRLGSTIDHEINIQYYEKLISDAIESEFRPILVSVPYYHKYTENFPENWLDQNYFTILDGLANKFSIPYLNYASDSAITNNHQFFRNSDHLGPDGRKEFNKIFWQNLIELGYFDEAILTNELIK